MSLMMGEEINFLYDYLISNGVIVDFRKPNVIRISPVPLYNSFLDVYYLYKHIKDFVNNIKK